MLSFGKRTPYVVPCKVVCGFVGVGVWCSVVGFGFGGCVRGLLTSSPTSFDEDDEFAFGGAVFEVGGEFGCGAAEVLFEFFGEFAGEDDLAIGKDVGEFGEEFLDAIGGFVEGDGGVEVFE